MRESSSPTTTTASTGLLTHPLLLTPEESQVILMVRAIEHGGVELKIQDYKIVFVDEHRKHKFA